MAEAQAHGLGGGKQDMARLQVVGVAQRGVGARLAWAQAERLLEGRRCLGPPPLLAEHVAQVDQCRLPRCATPTQMLGGPNCFVWLPRRCSEDLLVWFSLES